MKKENTDKRITKYVNKKIKQWRKAGILSEGHSLAEDGVVPYVLLDMFMFADFIEGLYEEISSR